MQSQQLPVSRLMHWAKWPGQKTSDGRVLFCIHQI